MNVLKLASSPPFEAMIFNGFTKFYKDSHNQISELVTF